MKLLYEQHEGLHQVSADISNARVHLVFVHGLGGGGHSTWDAGDKSEIGYWPETIAKEHPRCGVWTFHYTARILEGNPFARASTLDILDRARWMLGWMGQLDIAAKPIVFVAHSLGGVLVKQALQLAQNLGVPEWRKIWKQTRTIVFLGTPHTGSDIANVALRVAEIAAHASWTARLFLRPSVALKNLQKNNPTLRLLGDWYRFQAPHNRIETVAYAEGRPILGKLVVDESSADPHMEVGRMISLSDANHITLAKPGHRSNLVYKDVNKIVESAEEFEPTAAVEVEDANTLALQTENHQLAARLYGEWWERHLNEDVAKVSVFRISPDLLISSFRFDGKGYSHTGQYVSKWYSVLARVDLDRVQNLAIVRYVWNGEVISTKEKFNGFSVYKFMLPDRANEPITRGEGYYWNVDEQNAEKTQIRHIELRRATEPNVVAEMERKQDAERANRIQAVLKDWL